MIQSVAVFCGSKNGNNPLFVTHTATLGKLIAEKGLQLVYGGGNKGLMGIVANAALEHKGRVMGVIPEVLVAWEHQHTALTELTVVPDMHIRKKKMYDMCDAAIILPGGIGTLDELFEMLTWNQLKIHEKKIYFMNSDGFYDHLIKHMHLLQEEGFLYEPVEERITFCSDPEEVIDAIFTTI